MNTQYRWFYSKNKVGDPKPTACVCLVEEGEHSGIGLALCSRTDNPKYSTGRDIAFNRARYALKRDISALKINRLEALNVLYDVENYETAALPRLPRHVAHESAVMNFHSLFNYKAISNGVDKFQFQTIIASLWPPRANAQP